MPQRTFHKFHSGLEGLCSPYDDGLMHQETILVMEQKIAELSSQVEASLSRERWRDIEYSGMKVHDQYSGLVDEPSGLVDETNNDDDDDDDDDHVKNTPHYY
ncbi:hypothetical protein HAX54_021819 [Datura stramonium]|uniref:Uncharacterized protein n=1 Tax=Datura stramonium TaxID=4076 RepID=A0ABS8S3S7_DATST|nr:hypothetical protein [Datura stramonium]